MKPSHDRYVNNHKLFSSYRIFIAECKKDFLLIVDTSYSIGLNGYFDASVKPFLENLVMSPKLNVGEDGTHVGLILFSSEKKTRIKLRIGQIMGADELADYLDRLRYDSISGGKTRTELALNLAKSVRPCTV